MDTLDVSELSHGRETGSSIQDQYRNNKDGHVDLRLYLIFPISPSPLIGLWSSLALTERKRVLPFKINMEITRVVMSI